MRTLYIGIDPDVRVLNAALITDQKQVLAVFKKSNPLSEGKGDQALANAAGKACRLVEDVIAYLVAHIDYSVYGSVVTVVESQNMSQTKKLRESGKNVSYESVKMTAQVAGIMMGVFDNLSNKMIFVQPMDWKGTLSKVVAHNRYYHHLGLTTDPAKAVKNNYPINMKDLCSWSSDKINPGDFADINDSLGLALYGANKKL